MLQNQNSKISISLSLWSQLLAFFFFSLCYDGVSVVLQKMYTCGAYLLFIENTNFGEGVKAAGLWSIALPLLRVLRSRFSQIKKEGRWPSVVNMLIAGPPGNDTMLFPRRSVLIDRMPFAGYPYFKIAYGEFMDLNRMAFWKMSHNLFSYMTIILKCFSAESICPMLEGSAYELPPQCLRFSLLCLFLLVDYIPVVIPRL